MQIKHIEAEDMKKEMNEVQMRKYAEYDDIRSSVSFFLYFNRLKYVLIITVIKR